MRRSIARSFAHSGLFALFGALMLATPQSATAQFAYAFGNAHFDSGTDVGLDADGNIYAFGYFNGDIDFAVGPETAELKSNDTDAYVASYDSLGNVRFAFRIGNGYSIGESAGGIAVEESGRFYVTGSQPFGAIDFDPDPIEEANTFGLVYLAAYERDGSYRWSVPITGAHTSGGETYDLSLDGDGNLYIAGRYTTYLDFDPDDNDRGDISSQGSMEAFWASFTTDGVYRFAYTLGGPGADSAWGIVADTDGNVYLTGEFTGTAAFDPDDLDNDGDRIERTAVGTDDIFIASYTAAGHLRWLNTFGGPALAESDRGYAIDIDALDNVYVAGEGSNVLVFDPEDTNQDGNTNERLADANGSAFLVSYTAEGVYRFADVLQGGMSSARDIVTDDEGVSFITGTFAGATDFAPGTAEITIPNSGGTDVFVASYGADGAFRKVFSLTGTGLLVGQGIAIDARETVVVTGGFSVMMDLGRGDDVDERIGAGQNDIFIGRYPTGEEQAVAIEDGAELPGALTVHAAYPNPFAGSTSVDLDLPGAQPLRVLVYDVLGREVARLHDGLASAGTHQFRWDAAGSPPGLYLIHVESASTRLTRQVVKLR
ncbi:MAG: T9SS type A sorting domain-containing protein [Rhodothermales bacterium]